MGLEKILSSVLVGSLEEILFAFFADFSSTFYF